MTTLNDWIYCHKSNCKIVKITLKTTKTSKKLFQTKFKMKWQRDRKLNRKEWNIITCSKPLEIHPSQIMICREPLQLSNKIRPNIIVLGKGIDYRESSYTFLLTKIHEHIFQIHRNHRKTSTQKEEEVIHDWTLLYL